MADSRLLGEIKHVIFQNGCMQQHHINIVKIIEIEFLSSDRYFRGKLAEIRRESGKTVVDFLVVQNLASH